MIELGQGNLLSAEVDALVNPVNTQGIMGKGLALQFKKAFPDAFADYERACKAGQVAPGHMYIVHMPSSPRYIINFPTKRHWRNPSRLEDIRIGLTDLRVQVLRLEIHSIAIPPLGCGNGGLSWTEIKPLIVEALGNLEGVRVLLFEPREEPAQNLIDNRKQLAMTPARAALLSLMSRYLETGYEYRLSLIEVQKLAYFLQEAGEVLRLQYSAHYYGPYADNLRKALRNMEGHFTIGLGDGKNSPETPIALLPGAAEAAHRLLENQPLTQARLKRVAQLIEGFESPFGMELLGTVHWVAKNSTTADDLEEIIARVHTWSNRKRSKMKDGHIRAAWVRLREQGWTLRS